MILVALGTHGDPMARLVPVLERIATEMPDKGPFKMQHGATALPTGWSGRRLMGSGELTQLMRSAEVVIVHGGPATIGEARAAGHVPIVIPRQRRFGEHVDDHQLDYARRLAAAREIVLVEDVADLPSSVRDLPRQMGDMPMPVAHDPTAAVSALASIADRLLAR